jgi:putative ABC transport system permease protein
MYFKIAFRNLIKNKIYSGINLLGLAIGMAVAIIIGIWVLDEFQFNQYHTKRDRIAQVKTTQTFNGHTSTNPAVAIPLAAELQSVFGSDFTYVCLASWEFSHIMAFGEKKIRKQGMWVQKPFADMMTLQFLEGSATSLKNMDEIIISQTLSEALFGTTKSIGKVVKLDNKMDFKVGGVYENIPFNSTFHKSDYFLNWDKYITSEGWLKESQNQWGNHSFQLFVEMAPGADMAKVNSKIKFIPKKHVEEGNEEIVLHGMNHWHLYSNFTNGVEDGGRIDSVVLFSVIGAFVLFLACINFMNLSTARSEKRAKEVGIRKSIGSVRSQLVQQFLAESLLVTSIAMVISLAFVQVSLPWFNDIAGKQTVLPWKEPLFYIITLGFTIFTGLLAGSYPAFYLSGFNPISVLKGTFRAGRSASLPRKILVVMQFTVSVTLIIGTIIVFRQIQHAKSREVGYSREGLIYTQMNTPEIFGHYDALRDDLLQSGGVEDMAESMSPTTEIWSNQIGFSWKGKDSKTDPLFCVESVSHDFGHTVGWKIKEGRDFSRSFPSDSGMLILNEAAVKLTGFKNPVGEIIHWNDKDRKVVGVVNDMIMQSPYIPVQPTIYFLEYGWSNVIMLRMKSNLTAKEAIARIEPVFKKHNPSSPFEYKFIDEEYAEKFADEEKIGNLATVFAVLAIFISCLGLFGLASFVAEQRTKEIGVRKVLGASVFGLWKMLSKDFVVLVEIVARQNSSKK